MTANHPASYVDTHYLQAAARLLGPVKARSHELMRIRPGYSVLDVGCGSGLDTRLLGQLVGADGRVVGVDADAAMVAQADQRAQEAGLADRVSHQYGDAESLPLDSRSFDACRSERLFIHLTSPRAVLEEMRRVTRAGGWIVVVDADWGSLSIDSRHLHVERQLSRYRAEHLLANGYSGRQLFRLFKECGLVDIAIELHPIALKGDIGLARYLTKLDATEQGALEHGFVQPEELAAWSRDLKLAEQQGTFFGSMSMVLASGRTP